MQASRISAAGRRAIPARGAGFLLLPAVAILLSGCGLLDRSASTPGSADTLQVLAERHHVCSVAVAVIKDRKLHSVDVASGCPPAAPPDQDSVFQAASLSKPAFAYAVLKLVAQGKMALDAPVMTYLPQGYRHQSDPLKAQPSEMVTDPRLQQVTVRMVLNHTSGLPNWASGPLAFESLPGEKWQYSGEGYVLLQRAVESVTGQPLDRFMASQVFEPLAMTHSSYTWEHRFAHQILPGTKANGSSRTTLELKHPVAAFSLYTTAADYGKFLVRLLNDGDAIGQITASPVTVDDSLGLGWGLGWGTERVGDELFIWQWGNNTGYRAFVIASVRTGDGLVMLTNSENGLKLAEPVTRNVLPAGHRIFQSSMLGSDAATLLCNGLRLCL